MQIWAGFALRGLYADGAYYVEQILLRHSFAVVEHARSTSQILTQMPAVLLMWLGEDSAHAVALAFSLTTNLMPLALTVACLVVLPPADRAFGLFPVLIFLGPILCFACLWRSRSTADRATKIVVLLAAALVMSGCAIAFHDVLHPRIPANRAGLVQDVMSLGWLLPGGGQINVMALAGVAGLLALPVIMLPPHLRTLGLRGTLLVFIALAVLGLAEPPCPAAAFDARDNACLLTAPAMVALLIVRGRGWRLPAATPLFLAILGLTVATADGAATAGWRSYTNAMRTALVAGHGVVPWRDAVAKLPPTQAAALRRYAWPWSTPLMSVWLAPGPAIGTMIANPAGVTWQPFNPETLRAALGRNDVAPTRTGVVALLGKKRRRPSQIADAGKTE
jgi:hypothetical protein